MRKPAHISPALVVAILALVVAAGGGAWAAGGARAPGERSARPDASPTASAAARRSRGPRGRRGPRGFRGLRGRTGATGRQGIQGPVGPSEGFVTRNAAAASLPAGGDTTVSQLSLTPGRSYIVTASTELGNNAATANLINCTLLENFNPIASGSAALPALAVYAATVTLTGATAGGNIKLSCNPGNAAKARNTVITAIRVGSLQTQ